MQTQERPRFRQDLVAEPIEEQGTRFIDVMDPDSGNVFRFYEVEYALACAMDGQRDVAGIVKWAQEELGLSPSPTEVQTVIATLADLRFVDTDREDAKVSKAAQTTPAAAAPTPAATPAAQKQPAAPPATPAKRTSDNDLAKGVVVGHTKTPQGPGAEVELGSSGAGAVAPPQRQPDLPAAPDLALGAPGASASTKTPPRAPVDDIALGAPGARPEAAKPAAKPQQSDVSISLSDHVAVKPDDVKEAVRASKVVDVPKELQDDVPVPAAQTPAKQPEQSAKGSNKQKQKPTKAEKIAAQQAAAAAEKAPEKQAEAVAAKAPEKTKQPEKQASKPAVSLPSKPAEKMPIAPTAPSAGVSPVLVVLLILAVVGAGAFFVWKFVIDVPEEKGPTAKVTPPTPPPPAPPTEATAKVATETPSPQEIKAPAAGALESIEAADKEVKAGDTVATLTGAKALTADIAKTEKELAAGSAAIEGAAKALADAQQVENNAANVTRAQAALDRLKKPADEKRAALDKKKADLDKLVLKAPADGKLAEVGKVGDKVTVDQVIAKVTHGAAPVATFKVPAGTKLGDQVSILAAGAPVACRVIDAQAESIKVECPAGSVPDGTDVVLKLDDPANAPGATPPTTPEATGSAAGSAAPAAGSAAPAPTK